MSELNAFKEAVLVTSDDLRLSVNQVCWPAQEDLEKGLTTIFHDCGVTLYRAFPCAPRQRHGFISSQRQDMDIGIQYQQSLKDMIPASDLCGGLLNDQDRPPGTQEGEIAELFPGGPFPTFNEVDKGATIDALVTNRIWTFLNLAPSTTLHNVRWRQEFSLPEGNAFVWVFQISGAAPTNHFVGGHEGDFGERQSPMYFPRGRGTLKDVSSSGETVWSRIFVEADQLRADLGRETIVTLPPEETKRLWHQTIYQWHILHIPLHGVTRDQFVTSYRANHISNIAPAPSIEASDHALAVKAAMFHEFGILVHFCGTAPSHKLDGCSRAAIQNLS